MYRKIAPVLCACLLLALLGGCGAAGLPYGGEAPELPEVCRDSDDFSTVLLRLIDDGGSGAAVSPLSAYLALAMAAEGSAGETRAQLGQVLGAGAEEIAAAVDRMGVRLQRTAGSTGLRLDLSVWTGGQVSFSEDYLDLAGGRYGADIFSGLLSSDAVREAVDRWAADRTQGEIDPYLEGNLPEDTELALLGTVWFSGVWQTPFDGQTAAGVFYGADGSERTVEFMRGQGSWPVIDGETATGVVLPYDDGSICMVLLMPRDPDVTPADLACMLGTAGIARLAGEAQAGSAGVSVPVFETTGGGSLRGALQAMGLTDAFDPEKADFSRMGAGKLWLSEVSQRFRLRVGPAGTGAAAGEEVSGGLLPAAQPDAEVRLDHPFLYAVLDTETAIPLLMGTYNAAV